MHFEKSEITSNMSTVFFFNSSLKILKYGNFGSPFKDYYFILLRLICWVYLLSRKSWYCSSPSGICVMSSTLDSPSWTQDILWEKLILGACSHNASVINYRYKHANNNLDKEVSSREEKNGLWFLATCLLNKDFKTMSSTSTNKE